MPRGKAKARRSNQSTSKRQVTRSASSQPGVIKTAKKVSQLASWTRKAVGTVKPPNWVGSAWGKCATTVTQATKPMAQRWRDQMVDGINKLRDQCRGKGGGVTLETLRFSCTDGFFLD